MGSAETKGLWWHPAARERKEMKIITTAMVGAASLAALIFAAPAYADDTPATPGGAVPAVDPGAGIPGVPADHDVAAVQLPNGESYMVSLAPEQPLPEGAEEDDEMVMFWW
jgi:hypothetical protein